ncbi:unnamed protein product [Medioppia subpectinata]|uniref:Uncharacterized protein n=1 Tax=Medioppia subpectinata TaxID=1979941 RepID=A0A7R9QKU9_9ACAR|nr:unnamed protein product [Medioppia subpectinata]CAG2122535.1 unnamed protein product [Medioppia subpectinata]
MKLCSNYTNSPNISRGRPPPTSISRITCWDSRRVLRKREALGGHWRCHYWPPGLLSFSVYAKASNRPEKWFISPHYSRT